MNLFFSICSNNYLAQCSILGRSLKKFHPDIPFIIFLCDRKMNSIDYTGLADEVIELESIEPRFGELALKYNIIELNTCLKPRVFEYLFDERNLDRVIYLDPDIRVFHSLGYLFTLMESVNILLTPHILSPVPMDGKKPGEENFLMFGIYNLGFIGVKNSLESMRFISWWKSRTFELGYMDTYKGIFVDQLPVNHVPVFFSSVLILKDPGLNMAPWNLHERFLNYRENEIYVNHDQPLKFYHFSSFISGHPELPQIHYTRFVLRDRPDLTALYFEYNKALLEAGHAVYQAIENSYARERRKYLVSLKKKKWVRKFLP